VQSLIDPPPHPADPNVKFSLALFNLGIVHCFQFSVISFQFSVISFQFLLKFYNILPSPFGRGAGGEGLRRSLFLKKPLKPAAQAKTQDGAYNQTRAGMPFYRYQRFIDYISHGRFADRLDFIGGLAADVSVEFFRFFQFRLRQAHRLGRQMDLGALARDIDALFGVTRGAGRLFGLIVLYFVTHGFSPICKILFGLWKSTLSQTRIKWQNAFCSNYSI